MVGIYHAADICERYSMQIKILLWGIDMRYNGDEVRGDIRRQFNSNCARMLGNEAARSAQEVCPGLPEFIAIACQMIRCFVAFAPEIKKNVS